MQNAQPSMPSRFREMTRQQKVSTGGVPATAFNQVLNIPAPQSGFLANVWLYFTGTVTIPAAPTGNWGTYPPLPYALFRRIRLYTSENVEIVNTTGWGMAFYNLFNRRTPVLATDPIQYLNANGRSTLFAAPSGALVAGTQTFSGWLRVPVMTDDQAMLGLLLLQSLEVRANLELTMCAAADLVASGATAPSALSITVTPFFEFYSVPDSSSDYPNLDWVHTVQEETLPFTTNGDIIYRPQIGNVYLSVRGIAENSGAQVSPANIASIGWKYAQTVQPDNMTYAQHLAWNKFYYGVTVPDGTVNFDFSLGNGDPNGLDARDVLNSSQQTDLQFITTFTGLTPSSAQIRFIREQLSAIG